MTAYMLWMNDIRAKIKEDNPGISVTELSKKAGEMWKTVGDKTVSCKDECEIAKYFCKRFSSREGSSVGRR